MQVKKLGLGALVALPVAAQAAVPAAVTTAITDMSADALVVATAFLVATIAIVAFLFMRKGAR
jgi:Inovirus Coat protein B